MQRYNCQSQDISTICAARHQHDGALFCHIQKPVNTVDMVFTIGDDPAEEENRQIAEEGMRFIASLELVSDTIHYLPPKARDFFAHMEKEIRVSLTDLHLEPDLSSSSSVTKVLNSDQALLTDSINIVQESDTTFTDLLADFSTPDS